MAHYFQTHLCEMTDSRALDNAHGLLRFIEDHILMI